MNGLAARILNLVPGGLHASDPLSRHPAPAPLSAPAAAEAETAVPEDPRVTAALTQIQAAVAAERDAPPRDCRPRVPMAADYRALPVFQNTVRAACRAGVTGIGTRGVHRIPPAPVFGLDFTPCPGFGEDEHGPELDEARARAEAGFVSARRWFHSADTADFPAVTP